MSPLVRAAGLRMAYGAREVLRGVDLDVHRGEVLALLGPNGAGKSTTMEILEGLRRRTSGTVEVLGRDPGDADDAWRGRVGVVLQSWRDHADWPVDALLRHITLYHDDPADPADLTARFGLTDFSDRRVRELSGGQRRRMDLALALAGRPEVLFLDEPTVGLDPRSRRAFHDAVRSVAAEGVAVLATTHDMAEAERIADRLAVLVAGRITFDGSGEEFAAEHGGGSLEDAYLAHLDEREETAP
ncbi:Linearmycin resistance ATP-binding protein LnrL [Nocardiopsis dassonvillei]|uniref:ABC transporter ATP-binding protein n=1 Tax=Nocardiopsis dassonvillei TaxID=2014 RepID=UPI003F551D55